MGRSAPGVRVCAGLLRARRDDDDEDEEAELLRELEKIKKEREEERLRKARTAAAAAATHLLRSALPYPAVCLFRIVMSRPPGLLRVRLVMTRLPACRRRPATPHPR